MCEKYFFSEFIGKNSTPIFFIFEKFIFLVILFGLIFKFNLNLQFNYNSIFISIILNTYLLSISFFSVYLFIVFQERKKKRKHGNA